MDVIMEGIVPLSWLLSSQKYLQGFPGALEPVRDWRQGARTTLM